MHFFTPTNNTKLFQRHRGPISQKIFTDLRNRKLWSKDWWFLSKETVDISNKTSSISETMSHSNYFLRVLCGGHTSVVCPLFCWEKGITVETHRQGKKKRLKISKKATVTFSCIG